VQSRRRLWFEAWRGAFWWLPPAVVCRLFLALPERWQQPFWDDLEREIGQQREAEIE
jgi:hypothetical protein